MYKYKNNYILQMVNFFSKKNLALFSVVFVVCLLSNLKSSFAQESGQLLGLFSNGSNSLLNDVFNKVKDSVVQITTEYRSTDTSNPFFDTGNNDGRLPTKFGSGFVYDKSGYLITNFHVVSSAVNIIVTFNDGNTYTARLVGIDPYGDVAVLKLDNPLQENLVPVSFSNSSTLKVGDPVLAIGNPYGLDNTLTFGIVSQIGRLLPNSDVGYSIPNVIQTDAAINPGNSGGPLIDLSGRVVGMNTAIFSSTGAYAGVGFAIPSNDVLRVVPSLVRTGSYEHPWLGISGTKLTPELAESFGLPRNYKGVLIDTVVDNGPADKAGLRGMIIQGDRFGRQEIIDKDIIIAMDKTPVTRIDDIISYLDINKKVGDKITMTVNRNGQILDLVATLGSRPPVSLQNFASPQPPQEQERQPQSPGNNQGPFPDFNLPPLPDFNLPPLPDFNLPPLPDFGLGR
jgi:S1-C subfamily serine protease